MQKLTGKQVTKKRKEKRKRKRQLRVGERVVSVELERHWMGIRCDPSQGSNR